MNTPHVVDQLAAYLSGDLDEAALRSVRHHLGLCDECRSEFDSLSGLWKGLRSSADELPGHSLEREFRTMMRAYEEGLRHSGTRRERWSVRGKEWFSRPAVQIGVAACLVVVGIAAGSLWKESVGSDRDIAQLHQEVRGLSNLLTVSLLKQESASDRLTGVSWGYKLVDHDPEVESALVNTMQHDRNVNVRLAALDALARNLTSPSVRREIIQAFPGQKSPLMQVALVDLLSRINDAESRHALQQALNDPDLLPEVRKRIEQGLGHVL